MLEYYLIEKEKCLCKMKDFIHQKLNKKFTIFK